MCNNKKSRFISKNEGTGLLSSLGIRSPLRIRNAILISKMKTYCLVSKKLTDNTNLKNVKNKARLMMKSICSVCGLFDS